MFKKKTYRGFTLIELLIVISIIALLSSIILVALNSARAQARDASRLESTHQIEIALDLYASSIGSYPDQSSLSKSGAYDTNASYGWPILTPFLVPTYTNTLPPMDPYYNTSTGAGPFIAYVVVSSAWASDEKQWLIPDDSTCIGHIILLSLFETASNYRHDCNLISGIPNYETIILY